MKTKANNKELYTTEYTVIENIIGREISSVPEEIPKHFWGCSSVGRVRRSQCRGQGFDPPQLHFYFISKILILKDFA